MFELLNKIDLSMRQLFKNGGLVYRIWINLFSLLYFFACFLFGVFKFSSVYNCLQVRATVKISKVGIELFC